MSTIQKTIESVRVTLSASFAGPVAVKREAYDAIAKAAEAVRVIDAQTRATADAMLASIVAEKDALEAVRQSGPGELGKIVRELNALFKPLRETLELAESRLKKQIGGFVAAQRAAQTANYQAAAADHVSGEHAAAAQKLALASSADTSTEQGTSVREVWEVASIDAAQLPRDWMLPDEKRIKAHARATPADVAPAPIAGVVFVKSQIVTKRRASK